VDATVLAEPAACWADCETIHPRSPSRGGCVTACFPDMLRPPNHGRPASARPPTRQLRTTPRERQILSQATRQARGTSIGTRRRLQTPTGASVRHHTRLGTGRGRRRCLAPAPCTPVVMMATGAVVIARSPTASALGRASRCRGSRQLMPSTAHCSYSRPAAACMAPPAPSA
jgi:hypothetical protein